MNRICDRRRTVHVCQLLAAGLLALLLPGATAADTSDFVEIVTTALNANPLSRAFKGECVETQIPSNSKFQCTLRAYNTKATDKLLTKLAEEQNKDKEEILNAIREPVADSAVALKNEIDELCQQVQVLTQEVNDLRADQGRRP